jgi:hypothetical protein
VCGEVEMGEGVFVAFKMKKKIKMQSILSMIYVTVFIENLIKTKIHPPNASLPTYKKLFRHTDIKNYR